MDTTNTAPRDSGPTSSDQATAPKRRRAVPVLWISGAAAAALLVLGVTGTLSSWSSAILTNGNNSVSSKAAVSLDETGPGSDGNSVTCTTSTTADNTASCDQINKYGNGGATATLDQGDTATTTVTLTNSGTGDATSFTMTPGNCTSANTSGTGTPAADLCGEMQVAVSCTGSVTLTVSAQSLADFEANGAYDFSAGLASGASTTCAFTVTLPDNAPAAVSGETATQPIVWTLSA